MLTWQEAEKIFQKVIREEIKKNPTGIAAQVAREQKEKYQKIKHRILMKERKRAARDMLIPLAAYKRGK